jgi:hypothetical protein
LIENKGDIPASVGSGGNNWYGIDNIRLEVIPEPATLGLLALGFWTVTRREKTV